MIVPKITISPSNARAYKVSEPEYRHLFIIDFMILASEKTSVKGWFSRLRSTFSCSIGGGTRMSFCSTVPGVEQGGTEHVLFIYILYL